MKIYAPRPKEGFPFIGIVDAVEFGIRFVGQPMTEGWVPLETEYLIHLGDSDESMSMPFMADETLVFTPGLVGSELWSYLGEFGEFLPLISGNDTVYAYNALTFSSCFMEEESTVSRFGDGRIMYVKKYVFDESAPIPDVFRIAEEGGDRIFLSGKAVDLFRATDTTSTTLELVWGGGA